MRRADIANALQLLVKITRLPVAWRIFQPLIVHREPLHQILVQAPDGPLPELCAAMTAHAQAYGENGVEIVVFDLPRHLPAAFRTNYPEFPHSCLPAQFTFVENVDQVHVDRPHILLEQFRQKRLRQPHRLIFKLALHTRAAILRLVKDDFGIR